jgi:hypothetical protein
MGKNFCKIGSKWCKFCRRGNCDFSHTPTESLAKCPRIEAISTIQLADLLKQVSFETVFTTLVSYFPSQESSKEGYKEVFETLLTLSPKPLTNLNDLFIHVTLTSDQYSDGEYLDVSGIQLNKKDKFYGIEFCPWKDWVSMHISQESLDTLTKEDIVAGCLYEMTFFGFTDKDVQDEAERLRKSIEKCKNKTN